MIVEHFRIRNRDLRFEPTLQTFLYFLRHHAARQHRAGDHRPQVDRSPLHPDLVLPRSPQLHPPRLHLPHLQQHLWKRSEKNVNLEFVFWQSILPKYCA